MSNELEYVKGQKWFYEFNLPDGTKTQSYLPEEARKVHETREKALRYFISKLNGDFSAALDISCHEGYFSIVLDEYFKSVTGLDKNSDSLNKAKKISSLLGHQGISYKKSSVEDCSDKLAAEFVLCYGLLYHVENPVQILRKLALLTKKSLCIETQVLPLDVMGPIEDGSYLWQRDLQGMFGLCVDYSHSTEGGLTDIALVPSRRALEFMLNEFGFKTVTFYKPEDDDYEQFTRGHRVILFAEK